MSNSHEMDRIIRTFAGRRPVEEESAEGEIEESREASIAGGADGGAGGDRSERFEHNDMDYLLRRAYENRYR